MALVVPTRLLHDEALRAISAVLPRLQMVESMLERYFTVAFIQGRVHARLRVLADDLVDVREMDVEEADQAAEHAVGIVQMHHQRG